MGVLAKICGLKTPETVAAAIDGGAALVGFNFYGRSPRCVDPAAAGQLAGKVPSSVRKVGLLVDDSTLPASCPAAAGSTQRGERP